MALDIRLIQMIGQYPPSIDEVVETDFRAWVKIPEAVRAEIRKVREEILSFRSREDRGKSMGKLTCDAAATLVEMGIVSIDSLREFLEILQRDQSFRHLMERLDQAFFEENDPEDYAAFHQKAYKTLRPLLAQLEAEEVKPMESRDAYELVRTALERLEDSEQSDSLRTLWGDTFFDWARQTLRYYLIKFSAESEG